MSPFVVSAVGTSARFLPFVFGRRIERVSSLCDSRTALSNLNSQQLLMLFWRRLFERNVNATASPVSSTRSISSDENALT